MPSLYQISNTPVLPYGISGGTILPQGVKTYSSPFLHQVAPQQQGIIKCPYVNNNISIKVPVIYEINAEGICNFSVATMPITPVINPDGGSVMSTEGSIFGQWNSIWPFSSWISYLFRKTYSTPAGSPLLYQIQPNSSITHTLDVTDLAESILVKEATFTCTEETSSCTLSCTFSATLPQRFISYEFNASGNIFYFEVETDTHLGYPYIKALHETKVMQLTSYSDVPYNIRVYGDTWDTSLNRGISRNIYKLNSPSEKDYISTPVKGIYRTDRYQAPDARGKMPTLSLFPPLLMSNGVLHPAIQWTIVGSTFELSLFRVCVTSSLDDYNTEVEFYYPPTLGQTKMLHRGANLIPFANKNSGLYNRFDFEGGEGNKHSWATNQEGVIVNITPHNHNILRGFNVWSDVYYSGNLVNNQTMVFWELDENTDTPKRSMVKDENGKYNGMTPYWVGWVDTQFGKRIKAFDTSMGGIIHIYENIYIIDSYQDNNALSIHNPLLFFSYPPTSGPGYPTSNSYLKSNTCPVFLDPMLLERPNGLIIGVFDDLPYFSVINGIFTTYLYDNKFPYKYFTENLTNTDGYAVGNRVHTGTHTEGPTPVRAGKIITQEGAPLYQYVLRTINEGGIIASEPVDEVYQTSDAYNYEVYYTKVNIDNSVVFGTGSHVYWWNGDPAYTFGTFNEKQWISDNTGYVTFVPDPV